MTSGIKTIAEIVAFNEQRMREAEKEIDRINDLPPSRLVPDSERDGWIAAWKEVRAVCRDTISYLRVLEKRGDPA
ncbi:hypothetical protein Rleg9DRAFT_1762 [Rhizobium leguminosarum bv. trifolii WSM597]|uniref:Uncharacterized protein n=1 Tax=Rhizobium leguminosarum bv. trifolii WSM597 TaxID=754764 RepID=I9N8B8_RHILT|nr:hypothetical protein [Rhizobium leguminosarum]EJB02947.1 hypothetical protein Rleg9DRAFT_1762 [Rhizobium leguminosarum bv. trifolii WSM597]